MTPGGLPVLRLNVACGQEGEELALEVTMTGQAAREVAARLSAGDGVYVVGRLRAVARHARSGIRTTGVEVIASEVRPWPG